MGASSNPTPSGIRVVCLAGPSDSGKTTLVEQLVPRLADRGDRVATIKSIHHDIEIDTPGADTHRHRTAGAETVVGITPELTFDITARGKREPPELPAGSSPGPLEAGDSDDRADRDRRERLALASTLARLERRGYDVVLVEGFSAAPLPTVLVGNREPDAVTGEIIGHGDDDPAALVETIGSLEPISFRTEGEGSDHDSDDAGPSANTDRRE
ncbi:molybdopterin-guanine dinucleotide biosynthesis protein B [Halobiforma lacisalsi AJ5]|uniref:Molybdopterin-guanine dinucleotide biosynthesis protein B n=1 Tax=Natronobacterium lacisalsi AJ5 TaxID=358396 RepID=M0LJU4_NATLA|nr:molybdopterin-guanine dinucleotide biosynthesis protein B [Halobiforma lacisalsi]APW98786.1 molybdopterin-guanine dinucleotide biosynthesis protein B [Halobiforma lacisalsi AJ5]EMA32280.1 molybdopterin-guanine dinucleotide biosynthesis protein B [Halobiforma lacisalsi AJ5]